MRLFVALDLPGHVRAAISGWLGGALRSRDELRPVPEQGLHVTLAFLGPTAADRVERVWAAASAAARGQAAPLLTPGGVTGVPPRRPRLFALDLADDDAGRARALSASVAGALADAGLHEPDERPFWPHVTLARVRRGAKAAPPAAAPPALEPFTACVVTLYRSDPSRRGARYTALERLELCAR